MEDKTAPKKLSTQIFLEEEDQNDLEPEFFNSPKTNFPLSESSDTIIAKRGDFSSKQESPASLDHSDGLQPVKLESVSQIEADCHKLLPNEIPNECQSGLAFHYLENDFEEFPEQQLSPIVFGKSTESPSIKQILSGPAAKNVSGSRSKTATPYSSQFQANPLIKRINNAEDLNFSSLTKPEESSVLDSFSYRLGISNGPPIENNIAKSDVQQSDSKIEHSNKDAQTSFKSAFSHASSKSSGISLQMILDTYLISETIISFLDIFDVFKLEIIVDFKKNPALAKMAKSCIYQTIKTGFDRVSQRRLWRRFVNFEKIKEQNPFTFTSSFVKKSAYVRDINKDLDRTLPNDPFFQREDSKNALFRVLVAIASTVKEVGYIQGLNSIAGTLLTNLKEEDAYWMMIYLLKKRELKNLVSSKFPLVHLWNFQLKCFMRYHLPDIYEHIRKNGLTIEYFSTPWYLTLFTHYFQVPVVLKIWNFYLLRGEKFFIQFAMGIFQFYKKDIFLRDIDELGEFFKRSMKDLFIEDVLIDEALKLKVPKRMLNELKRFYDEGLCDPDSLIIKKNDNNKLTLQKIIRSSHENLEAATTVHQDQERCEEKDEDKDNEKQHNEKVANEHISENLKTESNNSEYTEEMPTITQKSESHAQNGEEGEQRFKRSRIPNMFKSLIGIIKVETLFGRLKKNIKGSNGDSRKNSCIENENHPTSNDNIKHKNQLSNDFNNPKLESEVSDQDEEEEKKALTINTQIHCNEKQDEFKMIEITKRDLNQNKFNSISEPISKKELNTPSPNLFLEQATPLILKNFSDIKDLNLSTESHSRILEPETVAKGTTTTTFTKTLNEQQDYIPNNNQTHDFNFENKKRSRLYSNGTNIINRNMMDSKIKKFRSKSSSSTQSETKPGINYELLQSNHWSCFIRAKDTEEENLDVEDTYQENISKQIYNFSPNITSMDERP